MPILEGKSLDAVTHDKRAENFFCKKTRTEILEKLIMRRHKLSEEYTNFYEMTILELFKTYLRTCDREELRELSIKMFADIVCLMSDSEVV